MKKLLLILLTMLSLDANANKVYEGKNCINYSKLIYVLEVNRDMNIKKDLLIKSINESKNESSIKEIMLGNIELIYNIPIGSSYSKLLLNKCLEKGKIVFIEI